MTFQLLTILLFLLALLFLYKRQGFLSFPFLFTLAVLFYLLIIPLVVGTRDVVTGATAQPTYIYYISIITYTFFYLVGVQFACKGFGGFSSKIGAEYSTINFKNWRFKVVYTFIFFISIVFCFYSLITRNIFQSGGEFLFTILGFDLLLVVYLIGRDNRSKRYNLIFFLFLVILFAYAGFRYRLAIILFTEISILLARRKLSFLKIFVTILSVIIIFIMASIGQVRSYGEFSTMTRLLSSDFDPTLVLAASGEQTVYFSTVNIVEDLDKLRLIGLEPFIVLFTHFIPAVIYPDKPRAEYLGSYIAVTQELDNTGTAMHDLGQAVLMFGHFGLPVSATLLGLIGGFALRYGLRFSPNRYYSVAFLLLSAVFIPSRGYLAQQVTWMLTFVFPLILLNTLTSYRLKFKRRKWI